MILGLIGSPNKGKSTLFSAMTLAEAEIDAKIADIGRIKAEIAGIEAEMPSYNARIDELLWNLPNVLDETVPYGETVAASIARPAS